MKIEARVISPELDGIEKVNIDVDYVEPDEYSISEWIRTELYDRHGKNINNFEITNLEELIDDMTYDEYADKTQYSNY